MKNLKFLAIFLLAGTAFTSCSNDDGDVPEVVNEEEVITTMTVTLTPTGGGGAVILKTQDLDGNGPNAPEVTVSRKLAPNTTYIGSIVLLNETESPAENITEEVEEEAEEHQFFYTIGSGLDATTEYRNFDADGNDLGTEFNLITGASSVGSITFTLRHEPTKPNNGDLNTAGGETDISATFNVTIE